MPIRVPQDVTHVRRAVGAAMNRIGATVLRKTRFVTAASELARNTLVHGGGGCLQVRVVRQGHGSGIVLVFSDQGPGIPDTEAALRDGFTTGDGLGLGLGGAKRLCDEFAIDSGVGVGTRVRIVSWVRKP